MRAVRFLLSKYLFPKDTGLLSFALWVSVLGVALGIAQLIVVLAVMTGFLNVFQSKYTRISGEIVVLPRLSRQDPGLQEKITSSKGVLAATPITLGQGMLIKDGVTGSVLEGIDLATTAKVTPWETIWQTKPATLTPEHNNWIWVGVQLAKKLSINVGDEIRVLIPDSSGNRIYPFTVTAITKFGIYEHDSRYAYVDLNYLKTIEKSANDPLFKVKTTGEKSIEEVADTLRDKLGHLASVKVWSEIHKNIFRAVQHQKGMLFLVLEIVVALAGINVINLLMMSVQNKRRDIAILRTMGMRFRSLFTFFLIQGAMVGLMGIVLGIGMGVGASYFFEKFQPNLLSESVYNVTRLPFKVQLEDVAAVSVVAFVICCLFSVIPAIRAARQRPTEVLRYE